MEDDGSVGASDDVAATDNTENVQDAANTATEDSDQDQTLDQDDISTFGDDTADLDDTNVAVPLATPINVEEQPECPQGFTLNDNGQCERTVTEDPECPTGFTFNPETDQCETSIPPSCPVGNPTVLIFLYNPGIDRCVSNTTPPIIEDAACEAGELNTETDRCVISIDPVCETGTFNPETDQCEQRLTRPNNLFFRDRLGQ